jgi:hypothetical protein
MCGSRGVEAERAVQMGGNRRGSVFALINLTNLNAADLLLQQRFVFAPTASACKAQPVPDRASAAGCLQGRNEAMAAHTAKASVVDRLPDSAPN